jgi:hypothetical protein
MKNIEIAAQLQRLRSLMGQAIAATPDLTLRSAWARYFCVLCAGLLENALAELYGEYVTRVSAPSVANYAISRLAKIQNPKADRFVETARAFDGVWADELKQFMDDNGRKEAIDSIMATRHQIAHGENAGITYARIVGYLSKAEEVLEYIESQVRPE